VQWPYGPAARKCLICTLRCRKSGLRIQSDKSIEMGLLLFNTIDARARDLEARHFTRANRRGNTDHVQFE
jgi:hypothetical protein